MAFKKLTAGLMASSMILGLAATASAEITTATPFDTATKMNKLGVVLGVGTNPDGSIDFNLGGNLTRAELVTTIVRSFGAEQAAQLAKGAPSFADVKADAWYSGYVAVAKNLAEQAGTTIGRDSNTFDPNANVSKAEALVFVMKFLGIKVNSTGANWYEAWIAKAVELGMISAEDAAVALANPGSSATRGEAFVILDFGYSAKVLEGGKSLYTGFVDSALPTVEVAAPAESTAEAKITISGKASDNKAVASVAVNGTAVEVKDGNFSAEVALTVGANTIVVSATDVAGNTASKTFTVTRVNAAAAGLEAGDITVAAGGTATVAAIVKDANGEAISGVTVEGTSTLGNFANGTFTAGEKAGEGTLTLKYGELTKEVKVTVTAGELAKVVAPANVAPNKVAALSATDAFGNAISGATFAVKGSDKAYVDGAGNFFASEAGVFTVTATAGGKTIESTVGVYGAVAGFKLTAPTEMVANGVTEYTFTATAIDKDGNAVPTYESAINLNLPYAATQTEVAEDGVAEFTVTADDALVGEELTFSATAVVSGVTVKGEAKVTVVAQVATGVKVDLGGQKYLPSNYEAGTAETATVTVTVVDQDGETMIDGEWTGTVSITGPAVFLDGKTSKELTINSFTAPLPIKATEEGATGAITINATSEGLTAGSATITAAVAQAPAAIQVTMGTKTKIEANDDASAYTTYSVQITDKYGVPVKAAKTLKVALGGVTQDDIDDNLNVDTDATLGFDASDIVQYSTDATTFSPVSAPSFTVTTDADGKAKFYVASWLAGDLTVTVKDSVTGTGALTAAAAKTFTVTPKDTVDSIALSNPAITYALRGKVTKLSYQLVDEFGNSLPKADVELSFTAGSTATINGKNASTTPVKVKTDANGVATVEFVGNGGLGANYNVSVTDGTYINADAWVSVDAAVPATITTKVLAWNGTAWVEYSGALNADAVIRVQATVKDQDGYAYNWLDTTDTPTTPFMEPFDSNVDLALTSSAKEALTGLTWTAKGNGVYETSDITVTKAGSQNFTVKIANLQEAISANTRSIAVRAGAPADITLAELDADGNLPLEAKVAKQVTVQILDSHGNVISAGSQGKWKVTFSNVTTTGYVSFRDSSGNELGVSGINVVANRNATTFFVLTDDTASTFDVTIAIDTNKDGVIDGSDDAPITATFTVVAQ